MGESYSRTPMCIQKLFCLIAKRALKTNLSYEFYNRQIIGFKKAALKKARLQAVRPKTKNYEKNYYYYAKNGILTTIALRSLLRTLM